MFNAKQLQNFAMHINFNRQSILHIMQFKAIQPLTINQVKNKLAVTCVNEFINNFKYLDD